MLNRKQGLRIYALPFALLGADPKPTNAKVSRSYGRETFAAARPRGAYFFAASRLLAHELAWGTGKTQ